IYTGEIRNWKEVGGADQPILAAGQLPGSPASFIWNKIVLDGETFPSVDTKKMDARHVLKYVEDHPYAIGYGALHLTKKSSKVKNVSVDHVLVNPDTIMTSPYRLKRELVFYTLPDSSPDVKNFVAYVVAHGQEQINQMMFNNQNQ
ncbi:MAG: substrate-binding domain-containing protein, partial [Clostridia bacterium]